jgi:hypothetical protein
MSAWYLDRMQNGSALVHALFLVATGCGGAVPPVPDGPDRINGRLAPGTNLCEYEEVAPAYPAPDQSGDWLVAGLNTPYLACADGFLGMGVSRMDWESGPEVGVSVDVQLYEVATPVTGEWERGRELDGLDGLDDCSIVELLDPMTMAAPDSEIDWLESPEVAIATEGWARDLVDYNPASSSPTYSAWLGAEELPPDGATFDLAVAPGGSAPELILESLLSLPSGLVVTEPDLGWGGMLPRAETTFRWDGAPTGDEPVVIELLSRSAFNANTFPSFSAEVSVHRTHIAWVGTVQGRALRTWAQTRHSGPGLTLGE